MIYNFISCILNEINNKKTITIMRENLLKKQPTWGLRRAQGTGQKSATPATLAKVILVLLTMFLLPSTAWGQETITYTFTGTAPEGASGVNDSWYLYDGWRYLCNDNASAVSKNESGGVTISVRDNDGKSILYPTTEENIFVNKVTLNYASLEVTEGSKVYVRAVNRTDTTTHYSDPCLITSGGSLDINIVGNYIVPSQNLSLLIFSNDNKAYSYNLKSITITKITDYNISIGDVSLTGSNVTPGTGAVTGMTGISFTPANTENETPATLALNNANITGDIVWNPSGNTDLTINLSGNNTLTGTISTDKNILSTVETNLSFTGSTGSLQITAGGPAAISGKFKTVNFGNFNLATSSPGAYWDENENRMADYSGGAATNLKITSEVYYPIWVHDYNSSTGYLQLTPDVPSITYDGRNADHTNDKGTISFDTNHTITLDKITYAQGNDNAVIVVGPSMSELTVNLDGESSVTNEGPVLCFTGPTNLTFTTSSSGASLSANSLYAWKNNAGSVTYNNGLVENNGTISYQAPPITVAGVSPDSEGKFSGISGVTFKPATIGVDQSSSTPATLTLNGANINGGIVWNSGDPLVIALNGVNSITTTTDHVICGPSAGSSSYPTLTFAKANGATSCQLTLTHNANDEIHCIYNFTATNTESGLYYIENEPTATVTSTILGGGSGTSADPFLIKTAQHLQDFASYVNKGIITNEYIKLNDGIDCSDLADFETIGFGIPNSTSNTYFKGTFDGNEKSISNLSVKGKGLFYTESFAPIKITKLTLDNLTVTGPNGSSGEIGAIASNIYSGSEIEGCVVKNSHITCETSFGNPWMGGIVGANDGGTITNCIVENTEITASVSNSGQSGPIAKAAGIVCNNSGSVSGCQVKGNTIVTASQESTSDATAGAIVCTNSGTLTNNTYEYTVKTQTKGNGDTDYIVKQNYDQRGLAASNDIIGEAELAGTKKVTISATALSDVRTLGLGEEMGLTYCLDERDASTKQLTALSVLPGSTISLVVSSENGYKPAFTLSNSDVEVTPEEEFANGWTIKYEFSMPEDDVTATIAFAIDLGSKNDDAFIYTLSAGQEAYPYTGEAIEPSISLTTDPQTPATLTKGTDYEIKDYFEVKEGVATPMYEEDGTTPKAPINVGSYKISITGKGNYYGTRELEFTIAKSAVDWSDNRWVAPEAKTDLKYTGEDLELVTAATVPEGVTIKYYTKYSSEQFTQADYDYSESPDEVWTEEVPTGKEIGYYAVFYKVEESDNYLAWGPGEVGIAVNIGRGEATITAGNQTTTYTGSPIEYDKDNITLSPATISKDGIGISYFEPNPDNPDNPISLDGAPTAAGTYTVKITLVDDHFDAETVNATLTIEQLDISEAVITLDNEELTYNGEEQSVNVTKVMAGDIEVAADYYEISGNSGTEAGNYTLIVTAKTVDSSGNPIKNNFMGSAEKQWKIKNRTVTTSELGVSENQPQGTYYSETEDLEVPEGVIAYIITGVNGNNVVTQRVSYIPKGVAVLVEQTTSTENPLTEIPDASQLPLKGTTEPKDVSSISGGTVYVLYKGEFVKSTTGTIPAKRCYLLLANDVAAGTRAFGIIGGGSDGSTAIKSINDEPSTIDNWYDMRGRRIEKPTKGLYILNGKKIVVK